MTPWTDALAKFLSGHERWLDIGLIVIAGLSILMVAGHRKPYAKALFLAYLLAP